jgi:hypothetical protein
MSMERRDTMDHRKHDLTLERLLGPTGYEVTCDECFERLDEYVELERAGLDADSRIPGFRAHLAGCPACREEHESLHALLLADDRS